MKKISDTIKKNYMEQIQKFLEEKFQDEVLLVSNNTFSIPWAEGEEEGYLNLTFSIPKGACYGREPYDGHAEAEAFKITLKEKAEKKAAAAKKKAEKIQKDREKRIKRE